MRELPLTQGYTAKVDDEDYDDLARYRWHVVVIRDRAYARNRTLGYMHRHLLGAPRIEVDHRDGDGLNNQRANLRVATHAQNMRNSRRPANNTSGHKGVSWDKSHSRWKAGIRVNNRAIHLGRFGTAEEAAETPPSAFTAHSAHLEDEPGRVPGTACYADRSYGGGFRVLRLPLLCGELKVLADCP